VTSVLIADDQALVRVGLRKILEAEPETTVAGEAGDGEAAVTAQGGEIATLGAGDFFGELALLATGRRTATVTTTGPCRILVLFGADFDRLRSRYPKVAAELEATLDRRLPRL